MTLYQFADVSHHEGVIDIQVLANQGHNLLICKASDNYHLPDIHGSYDFAAERHTDSRFVQNFSGARANGLAAGAYHFCRFDRPLPLAKRSAIIEANLAYYQTAIRQIPEQHQNEIKTAILDMEQSPKQLRAAGLNRATVSEMAKEMVTLFLEQYRQVILYSGSWWTNEWLTRETTEWMAERIGVWEPEYVPLTGNMPRNTTYQPSLPKGFANSYATRAADLTGQLFAWQYTAKGRLPGISADIDLNLTALNQSELARLFHGEEPTSETNADEQVLAALHALDEKVSEILALVQQNAG